MNQPCPDDRRAFWVKIVWAAGFSAGFLLSVKLWVSTRAYPLTPLVSFWPTIPYPIDYLWFGALLGLLLAAALLPRPRWPLLAFAVLAALLALGDQTRWQPWFYQYLCIGAALCCYPWGSTAKNDDRRAAALNACRLIIAGTYLYSGLQKLNWRFLHVGYPYIVAPLVDLLPESCREAIHATAFLAPLIETGIGVGLLTQRGRVAAVIAAAVMHASVLLSIGPWAHNWNSVVWPWNLTLPVLTALLFLKTDELTAGALVKPRQRVAMAALILFGILPAFNFIGAWDAYLSAALYSYNTPEGHIHLRPEVVGRLPDAWRGRAVSHHPDEYYVDLVAWSMDELNVPPYPAPRVYRAIAGRFLTYAHDPAEVLLDIVEPPDVWTGRRLITQYQGRAIERGDGVTLPEPAHE